MVAGTTPESLLPAHTRSGVWLQQMAGRIYSAQGRELGITRSHVRTVELAGAPAVLLRAPRHSAAVSLDSLLWSVMRLLV